MRNKKKRADIYYIYEYYIYIYICMYARVHTKASIHFTRKKREERSARDCIIDICTKESKKGEQNDKKIKKKKKKKKTSEIYM